MQKRPGRVFRRYGIPGMPPLCGILAADSHFQFFGFHGPPRRGGGPRAARGAHGLAHVYFSSTFIGATRFEHRAPRATTPRAQTDTLSTPRAQTDTLSGPDRVSGHGGAEGGSPPATWARTAGPARRARPRGRVAGIAAANSWPRGNSWAGVGAPPAPWASWRTSAPWISLPLSDRSIRRTKSCVNNAARSSTSIGPASESRAPKLVHCGLGVLLHHAGKRHFRVPMRTRCRRTSMHIGVDKRISHG